MIVNEEWLAGNDEYIERKHLKELKLKRKREERYHPEDGQEDKGKERIVNVEEDVERKRKIKGKGKEKVVDVKEDTERKRKIKIKEKEKVVDVEKVSEKNKRVNKQENNNVLKGKATIRQLFEAMRRLSQERKKVIREIGFEDLIEFPIFDIPTKLAFYVVDILNTTNMTLECPMGDIVITPKIELYEMLKENIHSILIENSEIEENTNENLIKFQDDEKLLQLKQWMKEIFKEPDMPEYLSSTSSKSDDDNDDGSQLADENEESYRKETHSDDDDDVQIVEVPKDEINKTHYTAKCSKKR
nr:ulp1 protease family, C-terminal catalytic domain-containing protein [Tanacetum cinerariifolium]